MFPILKTVSGMNFLSFNTTTLPSKTTIKVHGNSMDYQHYGFTINTGNSDSDFAVTYIHDAVGMTPAHMDYTNGVFNYGSWGNVWFVKDSYPCALNLDGTEAYKLDPSDYTKKLDGTPSDIQYALLTEQPSDWSTQWKQYYRTVNNEYVLNDQNSAPEFELNTYCSLTSGDFAGNFMVSFPKVYFRRRTMSSGALVDYNIVEISNKKLGDDWYCYAHINENGDEVDKIYLPMFKGCIVDNKLRSIPGKIPTGGTTATEELTAAQNCGTRWQFWDHSARECINDLLILMSKSIDSQTAFGKGRESGYNSSDTVTYGKLQTGTLVKKGAFFGYNSSLQDVKVFHMESFWANGYDRMLGMLLASSSGIGSFSKWKIKMTPPYDFVGTNFTTVFDAIVPDSGYLSKVYTTEYGSVPTASTGGTASNFYRDRIYTPFGEKTCVPVSGGRCNMNSDCGFRCLNASQVATLSTWSYGASPVYK